MLNTLNFHITNRCNLRCKHCLYSSGEKIMEELTTEEIYKLIDEFYDLSNWKWTVNIYWWESLLRNDILKIFENIMNKWLKLWLTTNFFNIKKSIINFLLTSDISRFTLNLDWWTSETHDWLRNISGHFLHTLKSIELLKKYWKNISINSVLHKWNFHEILKILDLCLKYKVDSVSFYLFTDLWRWNKIWFNVLNWKEWLELKLKVINWIRKNNPDFLIVWESSYLNKIEIPKWFKSMCEWKDLNVIDIWCDWNVYFCGLLLSVKWNSLWNIKYDNLIEILSRRKEKSFKKVHWCAALSISKWYNDLNDRRTEKKIIAVCPYEWELLKNNKNIKNKFAHITIENN